MHTVENIAPNTWRINEKDVVNFYLVVGTDRALLIDTGCGMGDIRELVRSLTQLPVDVVLTHMHCDHSGGVDWFESFAVHKIDTALIYRLMGSQMAAKSMVKKHASKEAILKKPFRSKMKKIDESHVFDLGGREIRVELAPGHTKGSIILIDESQKIMFTGDVMNPKLWMHLPATTTIAEWLSTARRVCELSKTYTAYCGHEDGLQPLDQLETTLRYGEEIVHLYGGSKDKEKTYYPSKAEMPHIVFVPKRVQK